MKTMMTMRQISRSIRRQSQSSCWSIRNGIEYMVIHRRRTWSEKDPINAGRLFPIWRQPPFCRSRSVGGAAVLRREASPLGKTASQQVQSLRFAPVRAKQTSPGRLAPSTPSRRPGRNETPYTNLLR